MASRTKPRYFDRNGFGYTIDRTNGKVLVAKPFEVNWAKEIDLQTGLPVEAQRSAPQGTTLKISVRYGCQDQRRWPTRHTKLFYVPTNHR
jgi:glucose dehydrogenase